MRIGGREIVRVRVRRFHEMRQVWFELRIGGFVVPRTCAAVSCSVRAEAVAGREI